jgi:hypothetical protein
MEIKFDLVEITPPPVLARLEGLHDRMISCLEMLRCMLVLRGVAAADMAAGQAEA